MPAEASKKVKYTENVGNPTGTLPSSSTLKSCPNGTTRRNPEVISVSVEPLTTPAQAGRCSESLLETNNVNLPSASALKICPNETNESLPSTSKAIIKPSRAAKKNYNYREASFENSSDVDNPEWGLLEDGHNDTSTIKHKSNKKNKTSKKLNHASAKISAPESSGDEAIDWVSDDDGLFSNDEEENDSDCHTFDEEPKPAKKIRCQDTIPLPQYQWNNADIKEVKISPNVIANVDPRKKNPVDYFNYYFDDKILDLIVEQTNLYSVQRHKENVSMELTKNELQSFLELGIYMGICKLPCYHDYWNGITRVPYVAEHMSHKRFELIRARLHFVDNTQIPPDNTDHGTTFSIDESMVPYKGKKAGPLRQYIKGKPPDNTDVLIRVRPLLQHILEKCRALPQHGTTFSIDESMVPYKGKKAGPLRQYIKGKPHKWGYKAFVLTSTTGIAYNFLVYSGSQTFEKEKIVEHPNLGVGGNVVAHLCEGIQNPRLSAVCFDNFFTSLPLISHLQSKLGLMSIGTIRKNRTNGCPMETDKNLQKKGRGSVEVRSNEENIACVKWVDNKVVRLAGTWAGVEPMSTVSRRDKKKREKIEVNCPRIVQLYNKNMGGVDLMDMLMELYRLPCRAKRWPIPLVAFLIDLALVNSFLTHSVENEILEAKKLEMSSKEFRLKVVEDLLGNVRRRGRPKLNSTFTIARHIQQPTVKHPAPEVRYDGMNHSHVFAEKKGRCRHCKDGYTRSKCTKCGVLLCMFPHRNCFALYHNPPAAG
ncbi:PiggyBac transposable element-derived protein 3 [Frankliniella fusca]|uniref:PiggyBac transposable element-derived protein 3 n=1 Tax=Frankliniella fusca TaxID=407009 RepID=A0AAE1GZD8_9NEOP|nr:PiggyBac transposable element-derived protein 3 [Frankliniella fusca]